MNVLMIAVALTHWAVPPLSDEMRLPDAEPSDGEKGGVVRIVAARDEYEPGSFVVRADADLADVTLAVSELKTDEGEVFPAADVDLRVVKVWYQNLNGWYSYFADDGKRLCPELLLHDDGLIRVDTKSEDNYARLTSADGKVEERWITPPKEMDKRYYETYWRDTRGFFPMRGDFRDAPALRPLALAKGEAKQFWLTVRTHPETPAGVYRGEVKVKSEKGKSAEFSIPVVVRVLPFVLPQPKAYQDPEKDFLVCSYSYHGFDHIMEENGGDRELAKRQLLAILRNQVAHNQTMHMPRGDRREVAETIEIMRAAGMRLDPYIGPGGEGGQHYWGGLPLARRAKNVRAFYDRVLGPTNRVYLLLGDEPGPWRFNTWRETHEAFQKEGFKFFIASPQAIFHKAAPFYGWHNHNCTPETPEMPARWNQTGDTYSAWYSTHHVGPENPAFNRRQNGLTPWLSGFTALCNYAHHLGTWNDASTLYKPMVFAYGTSDGVVDTLAWEGFREGVDDIRYGTLLCRLARQARDEKTPARHNLGIRALVYLAMLDKTGADLETARLEMIDMILELMK